MHSIYKYRFWDCHLAFQFQTLVRRLEEKTVEMVGIILGEEKYMHTGVFYVDDLIHW